VKRTRAEKIFLDTLKTDLEKLQQKIADGVSPQALNAAVESMRTRVVEHIAHK
jgi:hypothetical protein